MTPSKKFPQDMFIVPIFVQKFGAIRCTVLPKKWGVGGGGFIFVSPYTCSEMAQQNFWHTCNHAQHVCEVCRLWLLPFSRKTFLKFSPPRGWVETRKKSGKNRKNFFFSNFENLSRSKNQDGLGMIFRPNKRCCEMHRFRVISPRSSAKNPKNPFFSNSSLAMQFIEKSLLRKPFYLSISDNLTQKFSL
jgi:hypothetical protein